MGLFHKMLKCFFLDVEYMLKWISEVVCNVYHKSSELLCAIKYSKRFHSIGLIPSIEKWKIWAYMSENIAWVVSFAQLGLYQTLSCECFGLMPWW